MKRVIIFLLTNLSVMLVLGVVAHVLGFNRFLTPAGLDITALVGFAGVMGFGGAFISLAISKPAAKWSTGAQVITQPRDETERWLLATVERFARNSGLPMPEVAIYEGEPNAFATGATKNSSLVAVSTGLLQSMTREEAEAVLAHEVAHIANGDMVTLTLIQGVVNTFVIVLARVVAYAVDSFIRRDEEEASGPSMAYYITTVVCDMLFGVLASVIVAWFSRQREFRADAGAAQLMGTPRPMVNALQRLGGIEPGALPKSLAASGISDGASWLALFSSHPPIEERIRALQSAP